MKQKTTNPAVRKAAAKIADMRPVYIKPCAYCGDEFEGIKIAKFCSSDCRYAHANDKRREVRDHA